jgi:hypothetical protein
MAKNIVIERSVKVPDMVGGARGIRTVTGKAVAYMERSRDGRMTLPDSSV